MKDNGRKYGQPTSEFDDGKWLHLLLAPVREQNHQEPSPLAMQRLRRRIWKEISRKSARQAAA